MKDVQVNALSHITGGGLLENIPRVLPNKTKAVIDIQSWQQAPVFKWLQEQGNVEPVEMYRTFNCGVGMIIAVPKNEAAKAVSALNGMGENAWEIGRIEASSDDEDQVELAGL